MALLLVRPIYRGVFDRDAIRSAHVRKQLSLRLSMTVLSAFLTWLGAIDGIAFGCGWKKHASASRFL